MFNDNLSQFNQKKTLKVNKTILFLRMCKIYRNLE